MASGPTDIKKSWCYLVKENCSPYKWSYTRFNMFTLKFCVSDNKLQECIDAGSSGGHTVGCKIYANGLETAGAEKLYNANYFGVDDVPDSSFRPIYRRYAPCSSSYCAMGCGQLLPGKVADCRAG